MCIVAAPLDTDQPAEEGCAARRLTPEQRRQIALAALAGQPIAHVAAQHHVSRKFVYQQLARARAALDQAFAAKAEPSEEVLFYLPVTKSWLCQLVLVVVLVCHGSVRSVVELLADLFDYPLSVGTVHNIVHRAVTAARAVNDREDLSPVAVGLHDELFQASQPVLVGVDARSTYCYLLTLEEHRDGDTWGVRLLERIDRGLDPEAIVADFAKGLRGGQEQVLPGVPCRGDVFHALDLVGPVVRYLENRAYDAMAAVEKLARQQKQHQRRHGRKDRAVAQQRGPAQEAEAKAIALADDVATLLSWLQRDILALAGPDHPTRRELLDFVVAELAQREGQCEHRLRPVRVLLQNQGASLLAFAEQLDQDVAAVAQAWEVSVATVRELLPVQQLAEGDSRRWPREAALRQQLGERYHHLSALVAAVAKQTVRASSLVENLNSRLRNYFFLRRQLGPDYLELLRFFLNHRRFMRSEHPERVGKSPAELLSGQEHAHWLELLGFQRFRRVA